MEGAGRAQADPQPLGSRPRHAVDSPSAAPRAEFDTRLQEVLDDITRRFEHRWVEGFTAIGAPADRCPLLLDNLLAVVKNIMRHWRRAALDDHEAIALMVSNSRALVRVARTPR